MEENKKRPMTFNEVLDYWKSHRTELVNYTDKNLGFIRIGFIQCMDIGGNTVCVCGTWFPFEEFYDNVTKEDGSKFEI